MELSDEVLAVPHDPEHGGRSEVAYRIAWARTYLKAAGLVTNSERGVWSLTPEGAKAGRIDEKKLARDVQLKRRGQGKKRKPHDAPEPPDDGDDGAQPDEPDWRHELLEILHDVPADAFERLCQRLLRENGFVEVQVTGKSGDGGIDGMGLLRLQDMVTFRVAFQAKRWRRAVDPATIRDFRGATQGRADRGLIITTSHFTRDAEKEATREGVPPIDLIGGQLLVALLRKLKLGVKTEMVERVVVEPEWFKAL
jgi:restriction system protein